MCSIDFHSIHNYKSYLEQMLTFFCSSSSSDSIIGFLFPDRGSSFFNTNAKHKITFYVLDLEEREVKWISTNENGFARDQALVSLVA